MISEWGVNCWIPRTTPDGEPKPLIRAEQSMEGGLGSTFLQHDLPVIGLLSWTVQEIEVFTALHTPLIPDGDGRKAERAIDGLLANGGLCLLQTSLYVVELLHSVGDIPHEHDHSSKEYPAKDMAWFHLYFLPFKEGNG